MNKQLKIEKGIFRFKADGQDWEVEAELIGQLAIHLSIYPDGTIVSPYILSHTASGAYIWLFTDWVSLEDIRHLVELLAEMDFDAYVRDGCQDEAFVATCKQIKDGWDALLPDRAEHDESTLD